MFLELLGQIFPGIMHFILHASAAGSFPQALSKERENELLIKMEAGDDEARKTLIEHNLRLVARRKRDRSFDRQGDHGVIPPGLRSE